VQSEVPVSAVLNTG